MCNSIKRKICPHCYESFEAKRKNHLYCSNSCRVMACYRRKGYVYQSGHYKKEASVPLSNASVHESNVAVLCADKTTEVPVDFLNSEQLGMKDLSFRRSDKISMAGIMENTIGSGIVALGKHIIFDRDEAQNNKETLEAVKEILQWVRLQQQFDQPGQGILQREKGIMRQIKLPAVKINTGIQIPTNKSPMASNTSHQQIIKRMGLDLNNYG